MVSTNHLEPWANPPNIFANSPALQMFMGQMQAAQNWRPQQPQPTPQRESVPQSALARYAFGAPPQSSTTDDLGRSAAAISRLESGGRYDAMGPVTRTGDRAYGRYQVMGANIPEWTSAAGLGRMTPEQFVASPEAQDAVFRHRFGLYVQRYGSPERAAAAWFAGEGGMNDPNRQDVLGTTVQSYVDRFRAGY